MTLYNKGTFSSGIGNQSWFWLFCLGPLLHTGSQRFQDILLFNLLNMSIPELDIDVFIKCNFKSFIDVYAAASLNYQKLPQNRI